MREAVEEQKLIQSAPYLQTYQPEQKEPPDFLSGYAPYYHHKKPSGINPPEAVRVMGQLIPGMTDIPPEGKRKLMDTLIRYGRSQRENQTKERNTHVINTYVLPTLKKPFEVYATKYTDGTIRRRYIGLFEGKKDLVVIVMETPEGGLMWNIMNMDIRRLNDFRVGELIYPK